MVSKETIIAGLLAVLILISAVQTYQLLGLAARAKDGSIAIRPAGGLVERTSAPSYVAPAPGGTAAPSGGGCG
jgi:hypothetical protein